MVLEAMPGAQIIVLFLNIVVSLFVARTMLAFGSEKGGFSRPRSNRAVPFSLSGIGTAV